MPVTARRRGLPRGELAREVVADALAAVSTARFAARATVRSKGRDVEVAGGGIYDLGREIAAFSLSADGRQSEHLAAGPHRFQRLPEWRRQQTGLEWLWSPGEDDNHWDNLVAGLRHVATGAGSAAEEFNRERLQRYSYLLRPRPSLLPGPWKRAAPAASGLHAELRREGRDRVLLDVWLAEDRALRKVCERSTAPELALLRGETSTVTCTFEYWDFGVPVDLALPPPGQVLGYPAQPG